MPALSFRSIQDLDFVEIADLFTRCFEGYVIPINVTPELAANRTRRDGIDHVRSFVTLQDEEHVAIAFITPRGDAGRLAGMGVIASARGQGIGRVTVGEYLRLLREGGFREAVLEVFEQNTAAVRLYESFGFQVTQRLLGFQREPMDVKGAGKLREAAPMDLVMSLAEASDALPFIQSPEQAATVALPLRCWTVDGEAFACFTPPEEGKPIVVSSFHVRPNARNKGKGRELFEAVQAEFPGSPWFLPQIFPEKVEPFLTRLGFTRMELNQFEMRLTL